MYKYITFNWNIVALLSICKSRLVNACLPAIWKKTLGFIVLLQNKTWWRMVGPEKRLHEIQKYLRTIFAKQESLLVKKKKRRTFLPLRFTSLQKNVGRSVFYLSRRKWMLRLQFSLWKRGTFVCIGNVNLVEFIERSITGKYYYNSVNVTAILWFQLQPLFGDSR